MKQNSYQSPLAEVYSSIQVSQNQISEYLRRQGNLQKPSKIKISQTPTDDLQKYKSQSHIKQKLERLNLIQQYNSSKPSVLHVGHRDTIFASSIERSPEVVTQKFKEFYFQPKEQQTFQKAMSQLTIQQRLSQPKLSIDKVKLPDLKTTSNRGGASSLAPPKEKKNHVKVYEDYLKDKQLKIKSEIEDTMELFASNPSTKATIKSDHDHVHCDLADLKQLLDSMAGTDQKFIQDLVNCAFCLAKLDARHLRMIREKQNQMNFKSYGRESQDQIQQSSVEHSDESPEPRKLEPKSKRQSSSQLLPSVQVSQQLSNPQRSERIPQNSMHDKLKQQLMAHNKFLQNQRGRIDEDKEHDCFSDYTSQDDSNQQLKKQEKKIEFRRKLKDTFEKPEVDQEQFSKLVLFDIAKTDFAKKLDKKPALKSQSTLGGIGLKFKQEILKQTEAESVGKFYDYLATVRDRQVILSENLKDLNKPKIQETMKDKELEFLRENAKQNQVPLVQGVIQIRNNEYLLHDYQMTTGAVRAVAAGLKNCKELLKTLSLSKNQISDEALAELLSSIQENQMQSLKSIQICGKNEFGLKTVEALTNGCLNPEKKTPPFHLEDLRLSNCKLQGGAINNLMEHLSQCCFLKRLTLARAKLNEYSVELMCSLVSNNKAPNLIELDLSWNELSQFSMNKILKCFRNNEKLQYLNLSWNEISKDADIEPLLRMVKMNPNLTHLNVVRVFHSSPESLKRVLRAARKSISLQSIHLSFSEDTRELIQTYINSKFLPSHKIDSKSQKLPKPNTQKIFKNDWKEQMKQIFLKQDTEKELDRFNCIKIDEAQKLTDQDSNEVVLQRALGHREILGCEKWVQHTECFICGRWRYTIFTCQIASKKPPIKGIQLFGKKAAAPQNSQQEFEDYQSIFLKGSFESLMMSRSVSITEQQEPIKLLNILEFTQLIDPEFKTYDQQIDYFVETLDTNLQKSFKNSEEQQQRKLQQLKAKAKEKYTEIWKDIYREKLKYKSPQIVPETMRIEFQDENLFVFADFVKPSMSLEQVRFKGLDIQCIQDKFTFFPMVRKEELYHQQGKPQDKVYEEKQANVFKDWKADTDETFQEILNTDFSLWKVKKMIKDPQEIKEVEDVFRDNIRQLKDVYITLLSTSTYPSLTWLDFVNYVKQIGLVDDKTNMSTVDRLFIATNLEETDQKENSDKALCRFEFWEILVRLADARRKGQGSLPVLLRDLIENTTLKNSVVYPWQQYREEELWNNRDVNLVFDANMDALHKLFKRYITAKDPRLAYQDAINILARESPQLGLSIKDAVLAFGMCKMTVKNELNHKDGNPYMKLVFVEFLEYLSRAANIAFKKLSEPLHVKIEKLLDEILPIVGQVRRDVQRQVEVLFVESDDSMDENQVNDS